jgi:hypothetical protein
VTPTPSPEPAPPTEPTATPQPSPTPTVPTFKTVDELATYLVEREPAFTALSRNDLATLTTEAVKRRIAVDGMTPEQITALTQGDYKRLVEERFRTLTNEQITALVDERIAKLTEQDIVAIIETVKVLMPALPTAKPLGATPTP